MTETLSCGCCQHSRRAFLFDCAKCIGAAGVFSGFVLPSILTTGGCTSKRRMKIRAVYALIAPVQSKPDWPNMGYNFNPVMESFTNVLTNGCPDIDLVFFMVHGLEDTEKLLAADKAAGDIEGYLVVQLNISTHVIHPFCDTGKPVLYADFLFAGTGSFLIFTAELLNAGTTNLAHIASGNPEHLIAAANCFLLAKGAGGIKAFVDGVTQLRKDIVAGVKVDMRCVDDKVDVLPTEQLLKELKTKRIIEFEKSETDFGQAAKATLGIEVIQRPFAELNDLWVKADKTQAMAVVKRWKDSAIDIIDVSDTTLEESARMYVAMKQCLKNHDACAITINCLGGFYGGHIQAYPCLGFHELLNEGLIGACECDTMSALTMVVMTTMTKGRPGFISDPVLDTATKQIIYTHCVAPTKPFGPQKEANPFTIMTHSEDRKGASLRSILPVGYMTTSVEIDPNKKAILMHQAKAFDNSTEDRACRTKLVAVPTGDFEKLHLEWRRWWWHRVTYYGDLKQPVYALANALGWQVIEETV